MYDRDLYDRQLTQLLDTLGVGGPSLMREQTTYRGFRRAILSMLRHDALGDFTATYRTVGAQDRAVMLVWGTADEEITPSMIATAREALPGVDFRSVEGVGHGIVFQRPDLVRQRVLAFLGTAASAGEVRAPAGTQTDSQPAGRRLPNLD